MKQIRALRNYFLSRSIREKMLVLGLVAVTAVVWVSGVMGRGASRIRSLKVAGADLAEQKSWLEQREAIEKRNRAAVADLNPAKTLDTVRLQGKMDEVARSMRLGNNTRVGDSSTIPTNLFKYNTVRVQINNVPISEYKSLLDFENKIHEFAPYIGVESAQVQVNPSQQLSLQMKVFSVELVR